MKKVILVLLIVILISGCLDKNISISNAQYREVITEYQVVDVSLRHSEANFGIPAKDYVSVSFKGDGGALKEIRSDSIFDTVFVGANRTYVEKHVFVNIETNTINNLKTKWIAYITEYPK